MKRKVKSDTKFSQFFDGEKGTDNILPGLVVNQHL